MGSARPRTPGNDLVNPPPDLREFYALAGKRAKKPCTIGLAIPQLSAEDSEKLEAALHAPAIPPGAIATWLTQRGHEITTSALIVHRKTVLGQPTAGKCTCADA